MVPRQIMGPENMGEIGMENPMEAWIGSARIKYYERKGHTKKNGIRTLLTGSE
jgi:hypothetical protein